MVISSPLGFSIYRVDAAFHAARASHIRQPRDRFSGSVVAPLLPSRQRLVDDSVAVRSLFKRQFGDAVIVEQ